MTETGQRHGQKQDATINCPQCNTLQTIDAEARRLGGTIKCVRCYTDINIEQNITTEHDDDPAISAREHRDTISTELDATQHHVEAAADTFDRMRTESYDGDRAAVSPQALSEMHDDLIDAYHEITSALFAVERAMEATGDPTTETPKEITSARADDLSDEYDEPAKTLALMLLELNKYEYLWGKPETIGAENIREDGLTSIQQRHLDMLAGDADNPFSDPDTE